MSVFVSGRRSQYAASNRVENPFQQGQQVVIPKGTRIHTTMSGDKNRKTAGRKHTVMAVIVNVGWVDTMNDHKHGTGYVILPTVSWAGESGYWHEVQVTSELCAANGVDVPTLPTPDEDLLAGVRLDVIPSYGPGYDNTWRD